jgi:Flp pilus assembly protein TadB
VQARVPLEQALLGLAAELDDPASADPIIAALVLHARRRGDRLTEVLTGLARTARAELDLRRRVVAGRAELRRGVVIIIAISLGMVAYLAVFNRAFIAPYASPAGQLALAVVLGMFGAGFLVLRRAVASPKRAAFLPRPGLEPDLAGLRLVAGLTTTASASSSEVGRSR